MKISQLNSALIFFFACRMFCSPCRTLVRQCDSWTPLEMGFITALFSNCTATYSIPAVLLVIADHLPFLTQPKNQATTEVQMWLTILLLSTVSHENLIPEERSLRAQRYLKGHLSFTQLLWTEEIWGVTLQLPMCRSQNTKSNVDCFSRDQQLK